MKTIKFTYLLFFYIFFSYANAQNFSNKIDSLRQEKDKMLSAITKIDSEINKLEKANLNSTVPLSIITFNKVSIVLNKTIPIRDTPVLSGLATSYIPEGTSIDIVDYENDFLKIIYDNKIGYTSSLHLYNYDTIREQVDKYTEREKFLQKQNEESERKKEIKEIESKINPFKKLNSPIALLSAEVSYNSIDNPEANLEIKNISSKIIDAYEVDIYCYDNYGRPVNHYLYKNNKFKGISQDEIKPFDDDYSSWTLYGHENSTKIKINLRSVHFKDGTKWIPTKIVGISSK